VVHPAAGHETGTLVNALIAQLRDQPVRDRRRPAPGHRAPARQGYHRADWWRTKNDRAHKSLTEQFADHGRTGANAARLHGLRYGDLPNRQRGTVDAPIDRHPYAREKWRCVRAAARSSPLGKFQESSMGATASRSRHCWPASSRPAAPIRSGCISPISAIPLLGDGVYARISRPRPAILPASQKALAALGRQRCTHTFCAEHPRTGAVLE